MQLHYKSFGEGEPVVILHGLFGMLDNWKTFATELAKERLVIVPDIPNHGRSPSLTPFNYRVLADVLTEFLSSLWVFRTDVIGHSMGGKLGMHLALENEGLVDRLVVVDIAPKKYAGGQKGSLLLLIL